MMALSTSPFVTEEESLDIIWSSLAHELGHLIGATDTDRSEGYRGLMVNKDDSSDHVMEFDKDSVDMDGKNIEDIFCSQIDMLLDRKRLEEHKFPYLNYDEIWCFDCQKSGQTPSPGSPTTTGQTPSPQNPTKQGETSLETWVVVVIVILAILLVVGASSLAAIRWMTWKKEQEQKKKEQEKNKMRRKRKT